MVRQVSRILTGLVVLVDDLGSKEDRKKKSVCKRMRYENDECEKLRKRVAVAKMRLARGGSDVDDAWRLVTIGDGDDTGMTNRFAHACLQK